MRIDPYKNFKFLVEIEGIVQAGFSECTGFGSDVEIIEYREGGDPSSVHKLPGKVSYPDLTLKWGVTDSREMYDWHKAGVDGQVDRRSGSVILLDDMGQEKIRWNFFDAWPSKWTGSDFNATGNTAAIETLTVCCERLERA